MSDNSTRPVTALRVSRAEATTALLVVVPKSRPISFTAPDTGPPYYLVTEHSTWGKQSCSPSHDERKQATQRPAEANGRSADGAKADMERGKAPSQDANDGHRQGETGESADTSG